MFVAVNQKINKFTEGLLAKGPFTTEILAKEVHDFIKIM